MEVVATLQFTRPCLGSVRRDDFDLLLRNQSGQVIFLQTWWRSAFKKAAQIINRHHRIIGDIYPALEVESGTVTKIERRYGEKAQDVKIHECYDEGAVVQFRFALPHKLKIGSFAGLLEAVGEYIGISPYGWQSGDYGRFKLLEVRRIGTTRSPDTKGGQSTPDIPAVHRDPSPSADVPADEAKGRTGS